MHTFAISAAATSILFSYYQQQCCSLWLLPMSHKNMYKREIFPENVNTCQCMDNQNVTEDNVRLNVPVYNQIACSSGSDNFKNNKEHNE